MSVGTPEDQGRAESPARRPEGLVERVVAAYPAFRASAERLIEERPSEAILLSFMIVAGLIRFIGLMMGEVIGNGRADIAVAQSGLVGALLVAPLGVYLLSAVLTPALRAAGGVGDGYATRAAMAWSLIVSAPALFLASGLDGAGFGLQSLSDALAAEGVPGMGLWIGAAATLALLALSAYILSACLAAAHGFQPPSPVLAGLLASAGAAVIVIQGLAWLLGGAEHV